MSRAQLHPGHKQGGATLVVALVFLVILTLLGATVASNNTLQERMASNTRQHDLAFQAAEHALSAADNAINNPLSGVMLYINDYISTYPSTPTVTKPAYLLTPGGGHDVGHSNDSNYWNDPDNEFSWADSNSLQVTGIPSAITAANPRYTIEQMPPAACPENPSDTCFYFRVTARGQGKQANAMAIVQSMYKFKP